MRKKTVLNNDEMNLQIILNKVIFTFYSINYIIKKNFRLNFRHNYNI